MIDYSPRSAQFGRYRFLAAWCDTPSAAPISVQVTPAARAAATAAATARSASRRSTTATSRSATADLSRTVTDGSAKSKFSRRSRVWVVTQLGLHALSVPGLVTARASHARASRE